MSPAVPPPGGQITRLVLDVTECPVCCQPNVVLRRADDVSKVLARRTLDGDMHRHLWVAS